MRPTGVAGDVPPDRAGLLARRVWRVVKTLWVHSPGQVEVDDSWLDNGKLVLVVDLENPVHSDHRGDQPAFSGKAATAEPGPFPTSHERYLLFIGEPDKLSNLFT